MPQPVLTIPTLDLSPGTKRVLELAVDEARRMGHQFIGTEHVLLGLVRQSEGVAIEILKHLGVSPEEVRRQTRKVLQEAPPQPQATPRPIAAAQAFSPYETPAYKILNTRRPENTGHDWGRQNQYCSGCGIIECIAALV